MGASFLSVPKWTLSIGLFCSSRRVMRWSQRIHSAYWWVSCIHCVISDNTSSGKDCIGSTEDLAGRARDRSDGRDRRDAEKVDSCSKGE